MLCNYFIDCSERKNMPPDSRLHLSISRRHSTHVWCLRVDSSVMPQRISNRSTSTNSPLAIARRRGRITCCRMSLSLCVSVKVDETNTTSFLLGTFHDSGGKDVSPLSTCRRTWPLLSSRDFPVRRYRHVDRGVPTRLRPALTPARPV